MTMLLKFSKFSIFKLFAKSEMPLILLNGPIFELVAIKIKKIKPIKIFKPLFMWRAFWLYLNTTPTKRTKKETPL